MRVRVDTVQKVLLGSALLVALAWNLAYASEIKGLQLASGATGTRADVALDHDAAFKLITLTAPDRLVVDLPASSLARGLRLPVAAGVVKAIRTGEPTPGTARIVFDLAQPVAVLKPRIEHVAGASHLVLEWPGDGANLVTASTAPAQTRSVAASPVSAPTRDTSATVVDHDNADAAGVVAVTNSGADIAAASSEATSRLISELAARSAATTVRAQPQVSPSVGSAASSPSTSTPSTAPPLAPPSPTRIATGVPTRIATGVPTQLPSAAATAAGDDVPPTAAVKTMKDVMRGRGMRPLVIAIDAGHGGQDSGAIGLNGNKEKNVTLAIARELARQINATPGLRAYLTRDTDVFIPLNNRARLARSARADIFVSIHADAAENRSAKGSSVYVLSLKGASSQRARWLADKENASDMIGGVRLTQASNTLASVLLDLTQSGHMRASEDAAEHVLDGLKRVGNNHKPNIERANFAVLRTSDMPAMLVETAFISNPDEESRLTDPGYQRIVARAVLDGVNTYFMRQPPPGTMYAARADAQGVAGTIGASGGGL